MNPYRQIPKIDKLLAKSCFSHYNQALLKEAITKELDILREQIKQGQIENIEENRLLKAISLRYEKIFSPSLKPLINATGVIIHTNLGRSPIDPRLFDEAKQIATGYCNLEYDLDQGKRGDRYEHTAKALKELLGCEEALIVNNNASAVFLILNTFAKKKEVVVSRGELVEIGGSFRIPEVMRASGAKLVEVGTTNKTRIDDYKNALSKKTAMLMKVHKSNYSIEGFSCEATIEEISTLARDRGVIDYYDLGSGYLPELPWGLSGVEPSLSKILAIKPSLLSFSGDKLFGSIQAGIILGKKELINQLKKNQILRMFRVDKLTLALLERTVLAYKKREYDKIPVIKMLQATPQMLETKAKTLQQQLPIPSKIYSSKSYVGGGTMPNRKIPTIVLALEGDPQELERIFRKGYVIGRIENDHFVLDMRTVQESDFDQIVKVARGE